MHVPPTLFFDVYGRVIECLDFPDAARVYLVFNQQVEIDK